MDKAKRFKIVTADKGPAYEGLRALWCNVFGDDPSYVDSLYGNFGSDVKGYAVLDANGDVCSALTCYLCGIYRSRPVYVSYAICTRPDMRGRGLAGMLTRYVRDEVAGIGGISIVSPAEPSLMDYYAKLGYESFFFAAETSVMSPEFDEEAVIDCDEYDLDFGDKGEWEAVKLDVDLQSISAEEYGRCREKFLSGWPHIELSRTMLKLVEAETEGGHGLCLINRGDAICALAESGSGKTFMTELILNPALQQLSMDAADEIASLMAQHFGDAEAVYRSPGCDGCQSMAFGIDPAGSEDGYGEAYFGFPVD